MDRVFGWLAWQRGHSPEGEEDAAGGDPRDPHEVTPPRGHGAGALPRPAVRVLPPAQRHPRRRVPHRDGEPEEQQPRGRGRRADQRPRPRVQAAAPRRRRVAERVGRGRPAVPLRPVLRQERERVGVARRGRVAVGAGGVGEERRGEGGGAGAVVSRGHGRGGEAMDGSGFYESEGRR
jgi:hypothetical protein